MIIYHAIYLPVEGISEDSLGYYEDRRDAVTAIRYRAQILPGYHRTKWSWDSTQKVWHDEDENCFQINEIETVPCSFGVDDEYL